MRAIRLFVATVLLPVAAFVAYQVAIRFNGDVAVIDATGNVVAIGVLVVLLGGISRLASDFEWGYRLATVLGLGLAYFALTWALYGDPGRSVDHAPHLVWLGTSIVAFSPALVIIPASKWMWASAFRLDSSSVQ